MSVKPEKVDEMLKNYRKFLGRCKYLEGVIPSLEAELKYMLDHLIEDNVTIGGQDMDGMPHGTTPGNPTERLGLLFASGYKPEYIKEKEKELEDARKEYAEKSPTVIFVEAWLKGLTVRERWIVENQVIDGVTWRELATEYMAKFGETRTKRSLQLLRDKAMDKIYDIAE